MRAALLALLLLAACGADEPASPVHWEIQGATITCPGADTQLIPVTQPDQQVCIWYCVPYQGKSRQTVEAWFESSDGGLSWTFRQAYASDSAPEACQ